MLAERVIQDYKMFIRNKWDSKHWISWTDKFVDFYNHKKHSITKETPHDIFIEGAQPRLYVDKNNYRDEKLSIGDIVHVRHNKNVLDKKSLTNNWSNVTYTICRIDKTYKPYMYYIKDNEGNEYGKYYAHELLKEWDIVKQLFYFVSNSDVSDDSDDNFIKDYIFKDFKKNWKSVLF